MQRRRMELIAHVPIVSVAAALLLAMPAAAQYKTPDSICSAALAGGWQYRQPEWERTLGYEGVVREAQQRGYTLAYCVAVLRRQPLPPLGEVAPPQAVAAPAPAPAPAPVADPLVVSVQTLLTALGYDAGPPDGFAGAKTGAAISAFQQSINEKPSGRSSEALRVQLQSALAARGPGSAPRPPGTNGGAGNPETKPWSSGTGFFIGTDIIITNHHVVEGCTEIRARKHGAEVGGTRVLATSHADDLAVLRSATLNENYLKLRVGVPVRPAEAVLVFGYPLRDALSSSGNTTLGNVTALSGLRDDSRYIQISAAVQLGNSGGPVLDEAGRLIGVIESKLDALKIVRATGDIPQNVNFAIRSSTLANFLETNGIAYEVPTSSVTLPNTQLAMQAEAASVQLECRK